MQNDIFNAIKTYITENVPSIFFITIVSYAIYSTSELNNTITYRIDILKEDITKLKNCISFIKNLLKDIKISLQINNEYTKSTNNINDTYTFDLKIDLKETNLISAITIFKLYGFIK